MAEAVDDERLYGSDSFSSSRSEGLHDELIDPWCDVCYDETGQKIEADGFCPECNCFVCKTCFSAHRKVPAARNHKILRGSRMPKSQADRPVKYVGCSKHAGSLNDKFCLNHSTMVCSMCITEMHSNCKTTTIASLCNSLGSEDIHQLKDLISKVQQNVVSTKSKVKTNITDIEIQQKDLIKEAQSQRDKLITTVKEHYSNTITNITKTCTQRKSDMSGQVVAADDLITSLSDTISDIAKIENASVDPNLFIGLQHLVDNARRLQREGEDLHKRLDKVNVSLTASKDVQNILTGKNQLGDVKEKTIQLYTAMTAPNITFPTYMYTQHSLKDQIREESAKPVQGVTNVSSICVKEVTFLNVNTIDDTQACKINGIAVTSNGTLLVADWDNKRVKAFSLDNKLLSSLSFPYKPYDLTVMNERTAAVSMNDTYLHILDISYQGILSINKSVFLGYRVNGLTFCNNNLVVLRNNEPKCVKMIDLNGRELWSLSVDEYGQQLFEKLFSVTTCAAKGKTVAVVSDWSKDTLTIIDASDGNLINTIDVKDKGPHGLTTDDHCRVYVCCLKTKEVCVLSADFKHNKILKTSNDPNLKPTGIVYNSMTDALLVCYGHSDVIDYLKLK